jgi:hydrogenase nickel incorporation protein HypA/HybF
MHEFSVTESLLALALEKAGQANAARITRINLVLGEMSGVVGECVQFYFDALSRETIAAGAQLAFEARPTKLRCHRCQQEFPPQNHDWTCPACREMAFEIVSGRECYMESIEVE